LTNNDLKHNVSITIDQKLFRELENIRGREKRSTFIEHLIIEGLKNYKTDNQKIPLLPLIGLNKRKKD
jgi:metal-responsive CopG/Arc/MetJ family transcriptional regulator